MIDILISAGADPNAIIGESRSFLHLAYCILNPRSVEALLRPDANERLHNSFDALPQEVMGKSWKVDREENAELDEDVMKIIREVRKAPPLRAIGQAVVGHF